LTVQAPDQVLDVDGPAPRDPYAVLGVSPGSEDVVIRAAYRALMQKYTSLSRLDADILADDRRAREVQAAYDRIEAARQAGEAPAVAQPDPTPAFEAQAASFTAAPAPPGPSPEPLPQAPAEPELSIATAPHVRRRGTAVPLLAAASVVVAGLAAVLWAARHPASGEKSARPSLQVRLQPRAAAASVGRPTAGRSARCASMSAPSATAWPPDRWRWAWPRPRAPRASPRLRRPPLLPQLPRRHPPRRRPR
jgi:hypothetical protein